MGREPDEVALQRGPEGLGSTSPQGANHPTTLAEARAVERRTAGRNRESLDRAGRFGPGGPGQRSRLEEYNPSCVAVQEQSYKMSYCAANLAKRIGSYDPEFKS